MQIFARLVCRTWERLNANDARRAQSSKKTEKPYQNCQIGRVFLRYHRTRSATAITETWSNMNGKTSVPTFSAFYSRFPSWDFTEHDHSCSSIKLNSKPNKSTRGRGRGPPACTRARASALTAVKKQRWHRRKRNTPIFRSRNLY